MSPLIVARFIRSERATAKAHTTGQSCAIAEATIEDGDPLVPVTYGKKPKGTDDSTVGNVVEKK